MKIISHRGNINGPQFHRENSPAFIDEAIKLGYDVEIDLRYINNKLFLGHDIGQYEIELKWLLERSDFLWTHCKNLEAASLLSNHNTIKSFCHVSDPYIFINNNFIWVHDLGLSLNEKCIIPLIDKNMSTKNLNIVHAICTDYVEYYNNIFNKGNNL
jgi:hypothetical protein